jgi:hypothetical protein
MLHNGLTIKLTCVECANQKIRRMYSDSQEERVWCESYEGIIPLEGDWLGEKGLTTAVDDAPTFDSRLYPVGRGCRRFIRKRWGHSLIPKK